ncbi:MAG: hypothetical protein Q9218_003676 [Villophora microphyllina]
MPPGSACTPGILEDYNAQARLYQSTLRSFGAYGVAGAISYIAVWHHDPTFAKWHTVFDHLTPQGQYPVDLHVGVKGAGIRYAAIFAPNNEPTARQFTQASRSASGSRIEAAGTAVRSFMIENAVPSTQLSIYQNGVAKHQSVYEYTDPTDTGNITVHSQFFFAGLSEIFVAAALHYCYDNILCAPTTSVYPYMGFAASGSSLT